MILQIKIRNRFTPQFWSDWFDPPFFPRLLLLVAHSVEEQTLLNNEKQITLIAEMRAPLRHEIIITDVSLRQCSVRTVNRIEGFPIDQNAPTQRVSVSKSLSLSPPSLRVLHSMYCKSRYRARPSPQKRPPPSNCVPEARASARFPPETPGPRPPPALPRDSAATNPTPARRPPDLRIPAVPPAPTPWRGRRARESGGSGRWGGVSGRCGDAGRRRGRRTERRR